MMRRFALALLGLFILAPLAQAVLISFTTTLATDDHAVGHLGLMNYARVLTTPELQSAIANSLAYVAVNIVLSLLCGLPAAYALARFTFVGDRYFLLLILIFRLTPPVVLSLPIFIVFSRLGLVNSPVGIGLVHCLFNLPVTIWILESYIRAIPREFDETAFLDGHSQIGFFFRHLIPAIVPGIGVCVFFCFVFSWIEVIFARILTVSAGKPINVAISAMFGFQTDFGLVMAMTCLSMVPAILLLFLFRHHLAKGFAFRA